MEDFFQSVCGSSLFVQQNRSDPAYTHADFSFCFEYSLLFWFPCAFVWLLAPSWFYMIAKERHVKIKIGWLTYSKLIILVLLALIEIANLVRAIVDSSKGYKIYAVSYITPILLLVTYAICIFFLFYELKYGLTSSVLLFLFWFSLLISSSFLFRSNIYKHIYKYDQIDWFEFVLFYEFYGLVLLMFLLNFFSERSVSISVNEKNSLYDELNPYPETKASLLSRITFWWINPLILAGYKTDLTRKDMWRIEEKEMSKHLTEKLEKEWNQIAENYMNEYKQQYELYRKEMSLKYQKSAEKSQDDSVKIASKGDEAEFKPVIKEPSLFYCLVKIFYGRFVSGAFLKLIQDSLNFVGPVILDLIIKFTTDKEQDSIVGYFYTGLLFFSTVLQTFCLQHYFHRMFIVGSRVRTSLMGLIYKKSLRLSTKARKQATAGEMVNLMQVNTQSFVELTAYVNMLWSAPFQIIVCLIMLWSYLGAASLAGLATMILFIPLSAFLSNKAKILQASKLKFQDSRIKLINEILNGIKVLKLYGWEESFKYLVEKIRENELGVLLKQGVYNTLISFSWGAASFLVATASFMTYILMDPNNNLDASTAFVSLTLFNILRFPLIILPQVISSLIQANVAMKRIKSFLLKDEIDRGQISHTSDNERAIRFSDVDLGWSDTEVALKSLNFDVKKGELMAVVGQVGCGKSSLLSGTLGEMHKFKGTINLDGSVAYVPQQAWILNTTLRNNILFGKEYNEEFYNQVLTTCALKPDIEILPAGDQTEIGEKGINLSGGQKQRISLARAVYSQADIYILDDPLSAVDAHVGKHIFESVIGPKGILNDKTRFFSTNSLAFLPECDRIILLESGQVKEIGTYRELKSSSGAFVEFIGKYFQEHRDSKKTEDEETKTDTKKEKEKSALTQTSTMKKLAESGKAGEKLIEKEKVETGKVKFSILVDYFRSCGFFFSFLFIFFNILMNGALASTSVWLSDWSDNAANPDDNKYVRLAVYTSLGIAQYLFMLFADLSFLKMLMKSSRSLHSSMLHSILRSTMQFFESTPIGRIINRFSKDIEAVESLIPASYKMLIRCLFQVLITVIMISTSTPFFLIALIPITVIYIYVQRYYVAAMRQLRRLNSVSKSPIFSHFGETLTGVNVIRAFGSQRRFVNKMYEKIDENLLFFYPDTVSNRWLAVRLEFIGSLVTLFACLFAVIQRNSLTGGLAGRSISYSLSVSQVLNWLVRMSAEFESNVTSIERIKEYCETPHEAKWIDETMRPTADWPQSGAVQFESFSVKYREELDPVLKNIDCKISAGEKIGIVGRTGAGKSSLTLALFRLLESNYGRILIDNLDIKTIGLHDLRKRLTIIPQDPVLFSGTLRINLDPFELYSDQEIWTALELAHLKEFVAGLDKKLEFECSEGGENLSVGQRQLICLARALLRKTKILILDEATAAVDHQTDELIQQTIRKEFKNCTVITIAHRLNTILDNNRIMVLDQGRVIEFDSPSTLLANQTSTFYSMAVSANLVPTSSSYLSL